MNHTSSALAAAGAALALAMVSPHPAHAEPTDPAAPVTITAKPGKSAHPPLTYSLRANQTVKDAVVVANTGHAPLTVTLSAATSPSQPDGDPIPGNPTTDALSSGSWIQLDAAATRGLSLKPGQSTTVAFSIVVPPSARSGDHAAQISAKVAGHGTTAAPLHLRVSGPLIPSLVVSSFRTSYDGWNPFDGTVTSAATVSNNGNVTLGATATVTARSLTGQQLGKPTEVHVDALDPGETRHVDVRIPGVPALGATKVMWKVTPTSVAAAPAPKDAELAPSERTEQVWAMPWLPLIALAALALAVRGWRRRQVAPRRAVALPLNQEIVS